MLNSFVCKVIFLSFCVICKNCIRCWFWFCLIFVECRWGIGFFLKLNLEGDGDVLGVFINNYVFVIVDEVENVKVIFGYEGFSVGEKVKLRLKIMFWI